jgi:putative ATP-binding cassette transporter
VRACLFVLAFAVPIYAFYYYMRDLFANQWRRWLTGRFLDGYLKGRKYYELGADSEIDNPDQRISEDINTFTGRSINFLLIFLGSIMQLVAFSAVLWSISHLLVGVLAVYALTGTVVALYVFGNPLIHLNFWQLRREADFRFSLMRLRENAESIAFYRGEAQERAHIDSKLRQGHPEFCQADQEAAFAQLVPAHLQPADPGAAGRDPGRRRAVGRTGSRPRDPGGRRIHRRARRRGRHRRQLREPEPLRGGHRPPAGIVQLVLPDAGQPAADIRHAPRIEKRVRRAPALESLTLHPPQSERVLIKELSLA